MFQFSPTQSGLCPPHKILEILDLESKGTCTVYVKRENNCAVLHLCICNKVGFQTFIFGVPTGKKQVSLNAAYAFMHFRSLFLLKSILWAPRGKSDKKNQLPTVTGS